MRKKQPPVKCVVCEDMIEDWWDQTEGQWRSDGAMVGGMSVHNECMCTGRIWKGIIALRKRVDVLEGK